MQTDGRDVPPPSAQENRRERLPALEEALGRLLGQIEGVQSRLAVIDSTVATAARDLGVLGHRLDRLEGAAAKRGTAARWRAFVGSFRRRRAPLLKLPDEEPPASSVAPYSALGRPPLIPNVGGTLAADKPPPRVIMVTAFDVTPERLERVLDTVDSYASQRHVVPVILTDCPRFEVFRRRGMAFEYLPPASSRGRFAGDLAWDIYLGRRIALLRAKWRPVGIISFGSRGPLVGVADGGPTAESRHLLAQNA